MNPDRNQPESIGVPEKDVRVEDIEDSTRDLIYSNDPIDFKVRQGTPEKE